MPSRGEWQGDAPTSPPTMMDQNNATDPSSPSPSSSVATSASIVNGGNNTTSSNGSAPVSQGNVLIDNFLSRSELGAVHTQDLFLSCKLLPVLLRSFRINRQRAHALRQRGRAAKLQAALGEPVTTHDEKANHDNISDTTLDDGETADDPLGLASIPDDMDTPPSPRTAAAVAGAKARRQRRQRGGSRDETTSSSATSKVSRPTSSGSRSRPTTSSGRRSKQDHHTLQLHPRPPSSGHKRRPSSTASSRAAAALLSTMSAGSDDATTEAAFGTAGRAVPLSRLASSVLSLEPRGSDHAAHKPLNAQTKRLLTFARAQAVTRAFRRKTPSAAPVATTEATTITNTNADAT
jgi:hypothetical protein